MGYSSLRSPAFHIGVMTLLVFLGVMGFRSEGFLESAELDAYDWSMRLRPTNTRPNPPITLVSITDQDIRTLGQWPVTDEVLARTLDIMTTHHPRAIGVDIYRDLEVPPGRQELNRVLEAHPEILMVMKFGKIEKGGIPGPALLQGTDRMGFNDVVVDSGGIVRRGLLFLDDGTNFYRSFSLLLALQYLQQESIVPKPAVENADWVQLGKTVIRPFESHDGGYVAADAQGYQYLLDLERGESLFPTISLGEVLAGTFNPELIQDHIVLIGVVAQGVKDYFYTSQCGTLTVCPSVPGVELHGYMVHQLLRLVNGEGQPPIATFPDSVETGWIGLWVLGGGFIGWWVRGAWRFSLALLIGIVLLSGMVMSGIMYGKWIPFIPPVMGLVVNAMVVTAWISNREKQDRTLLMSLFSRHVSSEVAKAVWEKREQFLEKGRLRPQKLFVTTVFTDLEGFTTVAENMEPNTVLDWLNTYMERMVKIINSHGGMVDDYHGDMIKADFGVFRLEQTEENKRQDVNNAVGCAVALEQEMRHLNTQWQQQGLPEVRMRIGIQTGPVVVGSLGSEQRLKFTTIGDSVNIASRLESFQKDSLETWSKGEVCRILIGETTKHYLGDHPWGLKEVGMITLRGKANGISVYRLITKTADAEQHSAKTFMEQARG
ncbi:adenylate/guanylate cyclase domain-containing protein [uncultured Nitrospira sp.]|uniref:CHASE2 domain-containing protein n=1 Tax=uncultured Nitrospira sp. TaxID=157176 RepID=UPI00313FF404